MLSWLGGCPTTCGRYHSPGCRKDDRKDSGRVVFTLIDAIWVSARSVDQRAEHWSGGDTQRKDSKVPRRWQERG
jgi:hypothetical protein